MTSRVFALPSSTLGRRAAAAMAGSIALVVLFNALSSRGRGDEDIPVWQEVVFIGILLGLLASTVLGIVAVFRRRERSWVVLLPTALLSAVIVNELVQGVLQLAGLGE